MNDEKEARKVMASGLGKAEAEFVTSIAAPLSWIIKNKDDTIEVRNGSAFFLDAGQGCFGVTANHVIEEWKSDCETKDVVACQILDLPFTPNTRLIDSSNEIDIATFQISMDEISSIGKVVFTGSQSTWPPQPPEIEKGIFFSGFPIIETKEVRANEISFGAAPGGGVADSVSDKDVSMITLPQPCFDGDLSLFD